MSGVAAEILDSEVPACWTMGDCVTDISWSPDAGQFVAADAAGKISVTDVRSGKLVWIALAHMSGVLRVGWRADGEVITSTGQDGLLKHWDAANGSPLDSLSINDKWVDAMAWSPDGQRLAAAAGRTLVIRDRDGNELMRFDDHLSTVSAIAWRPDSRVLASACYRGICLFHSNETRPYKILKCLGSLISLAWSPDGTAICAGSQDRMMHYWKLPLKKGSNAEMKGYPEKVSHIDWNARGSALATTGGSTAVIWKTKGKGPQGTAPTVLQGHGTRLTQLCYQHHGELLASADQDGAVIVWQPPEAAPLKTWQLNSEVTRLAWSPDDQFLAAGNILGEIHSFNIRQ